MSPQSAERKTAKLQLSISRLIEETLVTEGMPH